jgi:hypothetical protein
MQNIQEATLNSHLTENYLVNLLNQLLTIYKNTEYERKQLIQWEEEQEFTILGIIELFTTEIRGYAFQITSNKLAKNKLEIIRDLQKLNLFNIDYFNQWYFFSEYDYPNLKIYIEKLNYIRLLMLEYLSI